VLQAGEGNPPEKSCDLEEKTGTSCYFFGEKALETSPDAKGNRNQRRIGESRRSFGREKKKRTDDLKRIVDKRGREGQKGGGS